MSKNEINYLKQQFVFNFTRINSSLGAHNSKIALLDLVNNEYLSDTPLTAGILALKNSLGFVFQDTPIKMKESIGAMTYYSKDLRPIINVNATNQIHLSQVNKYLSSSSDLLHEFGHVVASKLLDRLSDSDDVKKLVEKEKKNLTKIHNQEGYAKLKPAEFFAEVFKSMYSMGNDKYKTKFYQDAIRKGVPKTVEFIENELRKKGL